MAIGDRSLTRRQLTVLNTLYFADRMTARSIGVRSDVLWRLEERGLVARNLHDEWHITGQGERVLAESRYV